MPTLRQLEIFVAQTMRADETRLRSLARRLVDGGLLPKGRAGRSGVNAAQAGPPEAVALTLAAMLDRVVNAPGHTPGVLQAIWNMPPFKVLFANQGAITSDDMGQMQDANAQAVPVPESDRAYIGCFGEYLVKLIARSDGAEYLKELQGIEISCGTRQIRGAVALGSVDPSGKQDLRGYLFGNDLNGDPEGWPAFMRVADTPITVELKLPGDQVRAVANYVWPAPAEQPDWYREVTQGKAAASDDAAQAANPFDRFDESQ